MFRSIVASAAVMTLVVGASAQSQLSAGRIHQSVTPTHGAYSMTTGFQVSNQTYRSGPEVIFDNTAGAEYYFSTLFQLDEWMDEGAFAATDIDGNSQINGLDYEYCSFVPDLAGTAITTELRFYNDTVLGAGPSGWVDLVAGTNQNSACTYILAGLPGDTSGTGAIACWGVGVDLMCGFECSLPQESLPGGFTDYVGIGWMYKDNAGGLASTGPLLDSSWGATGGFSAPPGYGSEDQFEIFDLSMPLGSEYLGAFWFGGGSKAAGSFQTVLYGNGILNTDVVNADTPDLGDVLCLSTDTAFIPSAVVTFALAGTAPGPQYAMVAGTGVDSAGFGPFAGPGTTLLIDPATFLIPPSPIVMLGDPPTAVVGLPAGLPGVVYVQAFCFVGGIAPGNAVQASNALCFNN